MSWDSPDQPWNDPPGPLRFAFLDDLDDAFGSAPAPYSWAIARGARRNGPNHWGRWLGGECDAFREGVAEPCGELRTLAAAAALDCARHARGYPRPAHGCVRCKGLGILCGLVVGPGAMLDGVRVAGRCPDCDGRGWR
jgi:hypothetical protein